jgi:stage II sporulation protein D
LIRNGLQYPALGGLIAVAVALGGLNLFSPGVRVTPGLLQIRAPAAGRATSTRSLTAVPVRVCLTSEGATEFQLEVSGPYRIETVGNPRRTVDQGDHLPLSPVIISGSGLKIGGRSFPESDLEVIPLRTAAVWVDGHAYRGTLRIHGRGEKTLAAVNHVPLEAYVASVVDGEMPAEFGAEARKAQAIVARSFAVSQQRSAPREAVFDLYGSTRSQRYLGFEYRAADGRLLAGESIESRRVAAATAGMICTHNGQPFCTYYAAVCGGQTMLGTEFFADAAPPLKSVRCEWCQAARLYRWQVTLPRAKLEAAVQKFFSRDGGRFGNLRHLRPSGPTEAGHLTRYEADDGRQRLQIAANDLREFLGNGTIPSPKFTLEFRGAEVIFRGAGSGHGVGLCQWGARGLDRGGNTALQILARYYPGSHVATLRAK